MNYENQCSICGSYGTELHHIQFRSQVPALRDCQLNHIYLCPQHHRDGTCDLNCIWCNSVPYDPQILH